jgi:photosystem II stability/assembly factor-like uncharacterized protein
MIESIKLAFRLLLWRLPIVCSLICSEPADSQWRRLDMPSYDIAGTATSPMIFGVHFLDYVGAPETGFAYGTGLFKTSDGGWSWKKLNDKLYTYSDITFKNDRVGWLTLGTQDGNLGDVVFTKDGGDTWIPLGTKLWNSPLGIHYSETRNILAVGGEGSQGWTYFSSNEGASWEYMTPVDHARVQFAFASADSGIFCSAFSVNSTPNGGNTKWQFTADGGKTWSDLRIDSNSWRPLAIPHTRTYFTLTPHGNFIRTDDDWSNWQVLYQFPIHDFKSTADRWQNTSSVRGNLDSLFVHTTDGIQLSIDQGRSWTSLCGPRLDVPNYHTFYVVNRIVYCGNPWTPESRNSYFWRLNLDSLDYPTDISCRFRGERKTLALDASREVRVLCKSIDRTLDSARVRIRYDLDAFNYSHADLPAGWTVRETQQPGVIDLSVVKGPNGSAKDTTFEVVFSTYLSKPSADLIVEAQKVFSYDFDASCVTSKYERPDTLTVLFNDCESTQLLDLMSDAHLQRGRTIKILNLTQSADEIQIRIEKLRDLPVKIEVFDVLGKTVLEKPFNGIKDQIRTSGLSSGNYFIRLRQGSEVITRMIKIK